MPAGVPHTISADLAFRQCANIAAAAVEAPPPYVAYDVRTKLAIPSMQRERQTDRSVVVRIATDTAILHDFPHGGSFVGTAYPITPVFDALSAFTLRWHIDIHGNLDAAVSGVQPLRYDLTPQPTSADVVVTRIYAYHASYATDSSNAQAGTTHVVLKPYQFFASKAGGSLFFTDLYIDNATGLPSRVRLAGSDDKELVVDYADVQGHWLVGHLHYEETAVAPLHLARIHGVVDANYADFTFPPTAPDPRLTAPPTPTPAPVPTRGPGSIAPPGGP